MNDATSFLKTFGFKGVYNGLSCTRKISDGRIARITLSEENGRGIPTSETYVSLKVEIIGTKTGLIDKAMFSFDDHLPTKTRTDGRKDYPIGNNRTFQVISHCGWEWYIAIPKSVLPLTQAVDEYIGMFDEK